MKRKKNYRWKCCCGKVFKTRAKLKEHRKKCKLVKKHPQNHYSPCKCQYCNRSFTTKEGKTIHEKYCNDNPNREICKGHPLSEETKNKISKSMKKAHKENRAYNINNARVNRQASYPEKWLIDVLKKEFNLKQGKDYIRELPFYGFFLDFAFTDIKFCIEIDGQQHERFIEQKKRDKKKDRLLKKDGWKEIRVSWSWLQSSIENKQILIMDIRKVLNRHWKKLRTNSLSKAYINEKRRKEKDKNKEKEKEKRRLQKCKEVEKEWENKLKLIKSTKVKLFEYGYTTKLVKLTGLTRRQIYLTLKHFGMM